MPFLRNKIHIGNAHTESFELNIDELQTLLSQLTGLGADCIRFFRVTDHPLSPPFLVAAPYRGNQEMIKDMSGNDLPNLVLPMPGPPCPPECPEFPTFLK